MRRSDREVIDLSRILEIIEGCDCCRLGLVDDGRAYIVPLNFGYEVDGGKLTLYFHSAREGRKLDLIRATRYASFEMDTAHELVEAEKACGYSFLYSSVMGGGSIELIEDYDGKLHALRRIMKHCAGDAEYEFDRDMVERVAILKLVADELTSKEHRN